MKQLELIVCHGKPASGKSTYARQWQQEDPDNRVIVCREDICNMLGVHPGGKNLLVDTIEKQIVHISLAHEKNVIIDSTRKLEWEFMIDDCIESEFTDRDLHINFTYKEFGAKLTIEELVERDRARGSKTGEEVIRKWKK